MELAVSQPNSSLHSVISVLSVVNPLRPEQLLESSVTPRAGPVQVEATASQPIPSSPSALSVFSAVNPLVLCRLA